MNLTAIRTYLRKLERSSGILKNNPVLAAGLGLPFVIVPTLSLKNGVALSLLIALTTIPTALLATAFRERIPFWLRAPVFCVFSMALAAIGCAALARFPLLRESLGIYAPLTALNALMLEYAVYNPRKTPKQAVLNATANCLGFALVVLLVSAAREILANRTIWDAPFGVFSLKMRGVALPFFGFILIGFLSALFRTLNRSIKKSLLRRGSSNTEEAAS